MSDFRHPWFREWQESHWPETPFPFIHRKLWEHVMILQALREHGLLRPGTSGLGFGVGEERLPTVLSGYGCEIVASDIRDTSLSHPGSGFILADMCAVPSLVDRKFDFAWSACSLEHVGSLEAAMDFTLDSMNVLSPGGLAVHTTEFNLSSYDYTVTSGPTVSFLKKDIQRLLDRMREAGHQIDDPDFRYGDDPEDILISRPPAYPLPHLKLDSLGYINTSIVLIAQAPG